MFPASAFAPDSESFQGTAPLAHLAQLGGASHAPRLVLLAADAPVPAEARCVHVWKQVLDGQAHPEVQKLLSEEECATARRFCRPQLAERYRQAHGWLRSVLARYLHTSPERLEFRTGPHGKPRLAQSSLHFNLSHSDSLALLAVYDGGPVGIDVEAVRPLPEAMSIAERWFSPAEIRWIAASADQDRAFLRCWVCREAFIKATGQGLRQPLDSFALRPCGNALHMDEAALAECTPLRGHVAAVACL